MIYDCIIVGAGASGLFCGAVFPEKINGLLLEKTRQPGTKLLMSGSGQCNITHSGSIKDFVPKYGKNGGKIRGCLYKYNNHHLEAFFAANNLPLIAREDGKVFPKSMDARDIQKLLLGRAEENGFKLKTGCRVTSVKQLLPQQIAAADTQPAAPGESPLWQITAFTDGRTCCYLCRKLIVAAGGCSYPSTGSDGTFFKILAEDLKMDIVPTRPALTPINVEGYPYADLSGISFEKAGLKIRRCLQSQNPRKIAEGQGPLLLTHENFSGPLILNHSKYVQPGDRISINYLAPLTSAQVLDAINRALRESKQGMANLLARQLGLPKKFAAAVVSRTGEKPKAIADPLTEDTFIVKNLVGYKKAMVTAGGVSLSEIDCKTMECKKWKNLFIIGEALDIDGETGGYNLQFAYSSACAAARACSQEKNM